MAKKLGFHLDLEVHEPVITAAIRDYLFRTRGIRSRRFDEPPQLLARFLIQRALTAVSLAPWSPEISVIVSHGEGWKTSGKWSRPLYGDTAWLLRNSEGFWLLTLQRLVDSLSGSYARVYRETARITGQRETCSACGFDHGLHQERTAVRAEVPRIIAWVERSSQNYDRIAGTVTHGPLLDQISVDLPRCLESWRNELEQEKIRASAKRKESARARKNAQQSLAQGLAALRNLG